MASSYHAHLDTDTPLKGSDAKLFLAWLQGALSELVAQGVVLSLSKQGKGSRLKVQAPSQVLLDEAMVALSEAMRQN